MIVLLFFISISYSQSDSIASVKLILNQTPATLLNQASQIPKNVLTSLIELKKGDDFNVDLVNRRRIQILNSGYFNQATLLFFKSDSGTIVNYYLAEKKESFTWSASPFLDVNQQLGVTGQLTWERLLMGSSAYSMSGFYSKNNKGLSFTFSDRYWHPTFSYRFSLNYQQSMYPYEDLTESDRFLEEKTGSLMELAAHFNPDHSLHLTLELNKTKLREGLYLEEVNLPFEVIRLRYQYSSLDWPIYPFKGENLNIQLANYSNVEEQWYRSINMDYSIYYRLFGNFNASSKILLDSYFSAVPIFLRLHFDGSYKHGGIRNRFLSGDAIALLQQEIRFDKGIYISPEGFSSGKFAVGAKFTIGKIWNHYDSFDASKLYWSTGLNFNLFFLKNKYTISLNVDRDKYFFLDIQLRII